MATQKTSPKANTKVSNTAAPNVAKASVNPMDLDAPELPQEPSVTSIKRNMSGNKKIFTDLFKLMVANVTKQVGLAEHPNEDPSSFHDFEHTHPFRTHDKKGTKQTMCTPIGGHFHVVEWEESTNPDEPAKIKSISGPMVVENKKIKGVNTQVAVPANDYDDHTHAVEYIRTDEIQFAQTNVEATKVIAFDAQKTAPIPGVRG